MTNYINNEIFKEADFDFVSTEIDQYINLNFKNYLQSKNFDFLHGATGICCYLLERLNKKDAHFKKSIFEYIDSIHSAAIMDNSEIKWIDSKNSTNISLSHGMSSIIILLCKIHSSGHKNTINLIELIEKSVKYILSQKIDPNKYGSYFPYGSIEESISGSRLAWCYGDLGVGLCLLEASKTLNDDNLKKEALQIFDFALTRTDLKKNLIYDTSICHGTTGIAIIFKKIFELTNEKKYNVAAKYWIEKTIELYREDKIFYLIDQGKYDPYRTSLLEGKIGIALGILNVYYNHDSKWLKFLLI